MTTIQCCGISPGTFRHCAESEVASAHLEVKDLPWEDAYDEPDLDLPTSIDDSCFSGD
jgi:hypothetical protein